jgi:hypothetical protein
MVKAYTNIDSSNVVTGKRVLKLKLPELLKPESEEHRIEREKKHEIQIAKSRIYSQKRKEEAKKPFRAGIITPYRFSLVKLAISEIHRPF